MSILSLIFPRTRKTTLVSSAIVASNLQEIQIDVTESTNHEFTSTITQNPVESGSNVSDNVVTNNRKMAMSGAIVNNPFFDFSYSGLLDVFDRLTNAETRSQSGFDVLKDLWESKTPFRIDADRDSYDPVLITSFSAVGSAANGDALRFSMTVEEIKIVSSNIVLVPKSQVIAAAQGATSLVKKGKQAVANASAAVVTKNTSTLSAWTGLR